MCAYVDVDVCVFMRANSLCLILCVYVYELCLTIIILLWHVLISLDMYIGVFAY